MMNTVSTKRLIFSAVLVIALLSPKNSSAYYTYPVTAFPKWTGSGSAMAITGGSSALDSSLGISGGGTVASEVINQWSNASWFSFILDTSGSSPHRIETDASSSPGPYTSPYRIIGACGWLPFDNTMPAISCAKGARLVLLNSNSANIWNTSGVMADWTWNLLCFCYKRTLDVKYVLAHELGHIMGLAHPTFDTGSVMWVQYASARQILHEDDKRGVTQLYGPWTGWETWGQAEGSGNRIAYSYNVAGYYNNYASLPETGPRTAEAGVTPYGDRYLLLAGYAGASYSYAYFKIFTGDDDQLSWWSIDNQSLVIRSGMKLIWRQYSYQQGRMAIDIQFTDGTTLRDSGLKDQNNICVHPACRWVYPTGSWNYFSVDLTPLAGKKIRDILVAYDNGNSNETGQFRAYFDTLVIK